MSTIVYLRKTEPKFSAASRNPGAMRYFLDPWWVDAIGGEPTLAEIEALVNPPAPVTPPPAPPAPLVAPLLYPWRDRRRNLVWIGRAIKSLPPEQQTVPTMIVDLLAEETP